MLRDVIGLKVTSKVASRLKYSNLKVPDTLGRGLAQAGQSSPRKAHDLGIIIFMFILFREKNSSHFLF